MMCGRHMAEWPNGELSQCITTRGDLCLSDGLTWAGQASRTIVSCSLLWGWADPESQWRRWIANICWGVQVKVSCNTHTLPSQFIIHCSQQLCASKHYWSQKQNASVKQMHMQCHDATQTPATRQCTECMRHSSRETERWRTQRHGTAWFVN